MFGVLLLALLRPVLKRLLSLLLAVTTANLVWIGHREPWLIRKNYTLALAVTDQLQEVVTSIRLLLRLFLDSAWVLTIFRTSAPRPWCKNHKIKCRETRNRWASCFWLGRLALSVVLSTLQIMSLVGFDGRRWVPSLFTDSVTCRLSNLNFLIK